MNSRGGDTMESQSHALFSHEAEQGVLGSLLLNNEAIDRIPELKAEHFADDENRRLFAAVAGELLAGRPADIFTVFEVLRAQGWSEGLSYLNALAQSVPSVANVRRYAGIVIEHYKARQLMKAGQAAVEIAQDAALPVDERIDRVQSELGKLAEQTAQREASPLYEAMVRHTTVLEKRASGQDAIFSTGLPDVDRVLGGGLRAGDLCIVAARPGMGKTALGMTLGMHMAKSWGVGVLSMEMPEAQLCDRVMAALGHIDLHEVQNPVEVGNDLWRRVVDATDAARGLKLYIDDQGGLTIHHVAAKARAMRRKYGIDVLLLDYLQLMAGTDPRQPRAYQLEEVCRGLKGLAKALGIAVIALAQVNRRVGDGMPGLSDLKDSGAIEQDADQVAFIHRPINGNPELGEPFRHYAKLRFAKQRQGTTGDVHLAYIGNETRFASWSGPEPRPPGPSSPTRRVKEPL